jgi:hypothetical protein
MRQQTAVKDQVLQAGRPIKVPRGWVELKISQNVITPAEGQLILKSGRIDLVLKEYDAAFDPDGSLLPVAVRSKKSNNMTVRAYFALFALKLTGNTGGHSVAL